MNFTHSPLHDDDLEKAVLGTMLTEVHGLRMALSLLRPGASVFYQPAHQAIYEAVLTLYLAGEAVDNLSVIRQLATDGQLERAGGGVAIMQLLSRAHSPAKMETHCRFLLELFTKRRIGAIARQLMDASTDVTQDCFELLSQAQTGLNTLHDGLRTKQIQSVADLYDGVIDTIKAATLAPNGLTGVPSGLATLDRVTRGWQPADLVIIAARPSMGKTTLAAFMARHAAEGGQYPGVIFTLEMSTVQLVRKMVATEAGYSTAQLLGGKLDGGAEEAELIRTKAAALRRAGLYFDETPGISIGEFQATVARMVADYGIRFVVVDYLQLMRGDQRGNREQEISSISRALKQTAKEHNIPVLALAQLSRATEQRGGDKKPMLSDLRESGQIEQDADVIVFPYRAEYYKITEDDLGNPTTNTTELIIAKHRNGALANIMVQSFMAQGRYADLDTSLMTVTPATDESFGPRKVGADSHALRSLPRSDFDEQSAF